VQGGGSEYLEGGAQGAEETEAAWELVMDRWATQAVFKLPNPRLDESGFG